MKGLAFALLTCLCLSIMGSVVHAQTSTYILLRHAEKDTMRNDPPLTKAGEMRAKDLLTILKDYTPDQIYSTNFARTKATVAPLAEKFKLGVQVYDPRNLAALAETLLQQKGKTIVVVGHSNTTPALANLLLKENTYKDLPDNVYNQFWIVTVSEGKMVAKVVTY